MASPLTSLIAAGTKLWIDSVDPDLIAASRNLGATGATSNPIIISDLIQSGRFDALLGDLLAHEANSDEDVAWAVTDALVQRAQDVFLPVWEETCGNDGYVSFELDPLLEDIAAQDSIESRTQRYVELGTRWGTNRANRMIKVPATPAGLAALEPLAAQGLSLNVTLIFSLDQYRAARDAIWRGAQQRTCLETFKSVYSIFISRVDVYTQQHVPQLSPVAQGLAGLLNAKRMWRENQDFWSAQSTPLQQEIVFASTGVKNPQDPPWKYVAALVGSDIQTNPPATNEAVQQSGQTFSRTIEQMPAEATIRELDAKVDWSHLERTLMAEGLAKFATPQKQLLQLIGEKRRELATQPGAD